MEKKRAKWNADFWIPFLLYMALCVFKLAAVIGNRSIPMVADEFKYAKMSWLLLTKGNYPSVQYPLLYPLALMPAYLFGEHYYLAMRVLNVLYSSFVPVFTYWICRLYLKEKESGICAAYASVIPFQYITPMCLLSENLYFPLLLLAIYQTLKKRKHELTGDLILGVLLGMLFLTRHITLVILPVFALVWFMKQMEEGRKWGSIFGRGSLVFLAFALTYLPWVLQGIRNGFSLKLIVGFSIASNTNPEQLTGERLLLSGGYYLCYAALIIAPVLGLLVKSIRALDIGKKKIVSSYNQLWVMVCGLSAAIFTAVTRHSWRAYYNYPEFIKLKGRYVIYITVLFVILGAVALFYKKPQFKRRWANLLLTYALPAAAVALAWNVEVGQTFGKLADSFIDTFECVDMRRIFFCGTAFVFVVPFCSWIFQYLYDFAGEKKRKYLPAAFAAVLLLTELWGAPAYLGKVSADHADYRDKFPRYAAELAETLKELPGEKKKTYILAENVPNQNLMELTPDFYHVERTVLTDDVEAIKNKHYYVLTDTPDAYPDMRQVESYHWEGRVYELLETAQ